MSDAEKPSRRRERPRRQRTPEEIGYGKPPFSQRFGQPTRTGAVNRSGRPKKKRGPASLDDELQEKLRITENGKPKWVTKQEVIHKRLVNRAVEGDPKATKMVLDHLRSAASAPRQGSEDNFLEEAELAQRMLAQHEEEVRQSAVHRQKLTDPADEGPKGLPRARERQRGRAKGSSQ